MKASLFLTEGELLGIDERMVASATAAILRLSLAKDDAYAIRKLDAETIARTAVEAAFSDVQGLLSVLDDVVTSFNNLEASKAELLELGAKIQADIDQLKGK